MKIMRIIHGVNVNEVDVSIDTIISFFILLRITIFLLKTNIIYTIYFIIGIVIINIIWNAIRVYRNIESIKKKGL